MKKIFTLAMIMMVMTVSANAMSYTTAKNEALFLSDKMAYELNLTDAQYDAVYEINLDYMMSVNGRNDIYGSWWSRRNVDLQFVLTAYQYNKYRELSYFYRPLSWDAGHMTFNIYSHYTNKHHFYKGRPSVYAHYRGGNNKKPNYYADRRPAHHNSGGGSTWRDTDRNGNGSTWRDTDRNSSRHDNGHLSNNRDVAHNAHGSFSGKR